MIYLLDTDTVSFALRGVPGVVDRLRRCRPSSVAVSSLTVAELRYGACRRRSRKLHSLIDAFVSSVADAAFDEAAADRFGELAAALVDAGSPIGDFDALIAAQALALDMTLVSGNLKHFGRVPGLRVERWG